MTRFSGRNGGHDGAATQTFTASELLSLPVRLHGIQLGRPVDLLLDRDELRAIGFDVLCGDGIHRFLPLPTTVASAEEITIRSPLVMFEEEQLSFYRARSLGLESLHATRVEHDGRPLGTVADLVVRSDGTLAEVVVDQDGKQRRVPFDDSVRFRPESRTAA